MVGQNPKPQTEITQRLCQHWSSQLTLYPDPMHIKLAQFAVPVKALSIFYAFPIAACPFGVLLQTDQLKNLGSQVPLQSTCPSLDESQ